MHLSHKLAVRMAGPGSGKTRTVVHRCAYLLRVERVRSRGILVCCFNRQAALELRRRLVDLVGADARGVMILTYHGLALRLLGRSLSSTRGSAVPDLDALIPRTSTSAIRPCSPPTIPCTRPWGDSTRATA